MLVYAAMRVAGRATPHRGVEAPLEAVNSGGVGATGTRKRPPFDLGRRIEAKTTEQIVRACTDDRQERSESMTETPTVGILQAVYPDYRLPLWSELYTASRGRVEVLAGLEYFDATIKTPALVRPRVLLANLYLFRRSLLIQGLPVRRMLRYGVVIAEGNPRILSTWALLLLRRGVGRPTLLWGHALSRSHRDGLGRQAMRWLADGQICYTRTDAEYLRDHGYPRMIAVAPNAVTRSALIRPRATTRATSFVYVGRLVSAKRPQLMLDAFLKVAARLPSNCQLIIAGDGPLLPHLRSRALDSEHGDRVRFVGHISERHELERIYGEALAAVSPGYVGLAIIQAHSFGVPMIIADDEPHSPEIEAASDGRNAEFFSAGSVEALAAAFWAVWTNRQEWLRRSEDIARASAESYSLDGQALAIWDAACQAESHKGRPSPWRVWSRRRAQAR